MNNKNNYKNDIYNYTFDELVQVIEENNFPKFRAKQIYGWLYKGVNDFSEMKNLPKNMIAFLEKEFTVNAITILKKLTSKDGTCKYLLKLYDNNIIEAVLMKYKHGNTLCISTQVGCRMGCTFCASTLDGLVRQLEYGEMIGQIIKIAKDEDLRISNVVLMGSGEPLDNYNQVVKFLKHINDEEGLCISQRNVTLSTSGIVPKIKKLADEGLAVTLAVSFHNPFDIERSEIMPVNKSYPIKELIEAIDYYIKCTNRRVTLEYALIDGVNDSEKYANELGKLFKGKLIHVNLIPINLVKEKNYKPAQKKKIMRFKEILQNKYRIETTTRRELGSDINAACGQLRKSYLSENSEY